MNLCFVHIAWSMSAAIDILSPPTLGQSDESLRPLKLEDEYEPVPAIQIVALSLAMPRNLAPAPDLKETVTSNPGSR